MATKDEYAQLSLYVYNAAGRDENRPLEPAGWEKLEYHPDGALGFSYGIFRRIGTAEVVVAYAGTNQGVDGKPQRETSGSETFDFLSI